MGFAKYREKYQKQLEATAVDIKSDSKKTIQRLPSGSIAIDYVLGGGIPRGKVTEIIGQKSSGKTTLATEAMAEEQKLIKSGARKGGIILADFEHAWDPVYGQALGLDVEDEETFIWMQPTLGMEELSERIEECFAIQRETNEQVLSLLVIDSLAAMRGKMEILKTVEDAQKLKGIHARIVAAFLDKYVVKFSKYGVTCLILNQTRDSISIGPETMEGPKPSGKLDIADVNTPGGNAPKFFASARVFLRVVDYTSKTVMNPILGHEDTVYASQKVLAWAIKNKTDVPHKKDYFHIRFGTGVDNFDTIWEKAITFGIIRQGGAWFTFESKKDSSKNFKVQGKEKFRDKLESDKAVYNEVREAVIEKYKNFRLADLLGKEIMDMDASLIEDFLNEIPDLDGKEKIEIIEENAKVETGETVKESSEEKAT